MGQNYKFKSLEIARNNNKEQQPKPQTDTIKVYEVGETRTIDFIMLDGTRQNFPYSHYLTSWLGMENDEWVIKIFFATHLVTLKGYYIIPIYDALASFKLKKVKANDIRYLKIDEDKKTYVTYIEIKWKKNDDTNG